MEFVGKAVRKKFRGFGVFSGVIESYDPSTGFFRVVYEDGDSEELELSEIASVLREEGRPTGRPPKKRRRVAGRAASRAVDGKQMGEVGYCEDSAGAHMTENGLQADRSPEMGCPRGLEVEEAKEVGFVEGFGSTPLEQVRLDEALGESDGINGDSKGDHSFRVSELAGHGTAVVASCIKIGTGDRVFPSDANGDGQSRGLKDKGIKGLPDLNGNGIFEASEETPGVNCDHASHAEQKGVSGCLEENKVDARGSLDGNTREGSCSFICREVRNKVEDPALDAKESVCPKVVAENGFAGALEGTQNGDGCVSLGVDGAASSSALEEIQIKEEDHQVCENGNDDGGIASGIGRATSSGALEEIQIKEEDHQVRESSGIMISESGPVIASEVAQNGDNVAADLGVGETKGNLSVESVEAQFQTPPRRSSKRKLSENGTSFPPGTLRRSARRAAIILNSSSIFPSDPEPIVASSASAVMNNDHVNLVDKDPPQDQGCIPPTLPLPPSSKDLGIDELPALDIFSVYSCLRSFSTFLFLSPFTIEAFVASLKSTFVNPLIDCIHFSLLYTLKCHLKSLSGDDSKIATACLRSLDWEFLDFLTWPVYLVEYLLISGSAVSSGLQLARLKLLNGEYYRQPAAVKLEVLRCLCDDFMETEEIRGEIGKRALASELYGETDRTVSFFGSTSSTPMNNRSYKKRKVNTDLTNHVISLEKDGLEGSPLCQDTVVASVDDIKNDDWNSDDCCLCKMDGNLICCDGCPAAYHSRCVGVSRDLLPEGDWYCPECVMDNTVGRFKSCSPLQGGELLGIDPLGRIYFATYGYLLVLTSHEGVSCCYYSKKDLGLVIEMLKSSNFVYDDIVNAILSHHEAPVDSDNAKNVSSEYLKSVGGINACYQNNSTHLLLVPSSSYAQEMPKDGNNVVKKDENEPSACTLGGSRTLSGLESENVLDSLALDQHTGSPIANLDASTAALQVTSNVQACQQASQSVEDNQIIVSSVINKSVCSSDDHGILNTISVRLDNMQVEQPVLDSVPDKQINTMAPSSKLADMSKDGAFKCPSEPSLYINSYSSGQISSSIAKEVSHAFPSGIQEDMNKSTSDAMLPLLKIFSNAGMFTWPNVERKAVGMVQEKCGWCFTCKNPSDKDCLLRMTDKNFEVVSEKKSVGFRSKKNRKSHLTSIVLYILSIEERLNGLLSGPWQNPQYRKHWRKNLLKASTMTAVKRQLLILEANIRPVALTVDWLKYIDSSASMGSALFVSTKLDNLPTVSGGSRKRSRKKSLYSETISGPDIAGIRSGVHWWRGGNISRQLFRWKMLPRALTLRSGRQAGCKKIPGILYPEASDFAKRPKNLAWRASVELSLTATDLGLQVRDLDAHIKWNNIIGSEISLHESAKKLRPWKKVTIRRKCIEGENVKYLLDFGKRKVIPDIVTRNGIKLEDASSEKEKYWLNESFVPLNLLRVYEEKRLARADKKMNLGPIAKEGRRRLSRRDWLSHLISKRESCGRCICGHCKQDLVVRHAVKCESCEGFFHKRHVSIIKSTRNKSCKITCYNCQDKKRMTTRASSKAQKARSQNVGSTKCRSSSKSNEKNKNMSGQKKKVKKNEHKKASKKAKKSQAKKVPLKGTANGFQRPRTRLHYVFWLNGLLWTKKLNDERVQKFIETNVLLPQVPDNASRAPVCFICHRIYNSRLVYVSCEICREWFHGDALGVTAENVNNLLGFKCYKCCKRNSPECPFSKEATQEDTSVQSTCTDIKAGEFCSDDDMLLSAFSKKPRLLPTEEIQGLFCDMTSTHDQVPEVTNLGPCEALSLDAGVQAEESMASLE